MRKSLLLLTGSGMLSTLLLSSIMATAQVQDWANPKLTGINNEPTHATMVICPDAATARSIKLAVNAERVKSPFYRSLSGEWKYH